MPKSSLVSIIIPAHNAERYLGATLDSVLAQTYPDWEAIVIDDGSTDSTARITREYAERDSRIRYEFQHNQGAAAARNRGMAMARGAYIAFLDADDLFLSEKLERQISFLRDHPDCDVSYCDVWHFKDNAPDQLFYFPYSGFPSGKKVFPELLWRMIVNPLSVVMRSSVATAWGLFNPSYKHPEDWDYFLRLAYHGARFDHLDERLAKYRVHASSKSFAADQEVLRKWEALQVILKLSRTMTPAERKQWHMRRLILFHWTKYLAVLFLEKVGLIGWFYNRRREERWRSAERPS